jgi:hypothetical protein
MAFIISENDKTREEVRKNGKVECLFLSVYLFFFPNHPNFPPNKILLLALWIE